MAAGQYDDLIIEEGAVFELKVGWDDADGTLMDLSAYSAYLQVRKTLKSADPLLDLSSDDGDITLYDSNGVEDALGNKYNIVVVAPIEDTDYGVFSERDYGAVVWDLKLVDGDGNPIRILEGVGLLSGEVTR